MERRRTDDGGGREEGREGRGGRECDNGNSRQHPHQQRHCHRVTATTEGRVAVAVAVACQQPPLPPPTTTAPTAPTTTNNNQLHHRHQQHRQHQRGGSGRRRANANTANATQRTGRSKLWSCERSMSMKALVNSAKEMRPSLSGSRWANSSSGMPYVCARVHVCVCVVFVEQRGQDNAHKWREYE